jgi:hypothetical protein
LRSLEEFRKNPHVKIPHKSPSTNFQILAQFLIQKFIFPDFRPGRPRGPLGLRPSPPTGRIAPRRPKAPGRPIQPARRSRLHGKYVFLFRSCLPEPAASSLYHCHVGSACRLHRLHHAGRPRSIFSPHRRSPALHRTSPHSHFPSLGALASLSPSADTTEPSPSSPVLLDTARVLVRP